MVKLYFPYLTKLVLKKNKNNIESQLNFDFPWMFNFYKDTKEGDAARIRIMKMVKVGCS